MRAVECRLLPEAVLCMMQYPSFEFPSIIVKVALIVTDSLGLHGQRASNYYARNRRRRNKGEAGCRVLCHPHALRYGRPEKVTGKTPRAL